MYEKVMIKLSEIDDEEVKDAVRLINPYILNNSDLVTPEILGQDVVYHIAFQDFNKLIPNISKRGTDSEDNTLPRVHTCSNLLGCINGFGVLMNERIITEKKNKLTYTGAFNIFTIDFSYVIKPNNKLVYDAETNNEFWLFTYNKYTKTFNYKYSDQFIVTELKNIPGVGSKQTIQVFLIVKNLNAKIKLTDKDWLDKGYFEIVLSLKNAYNNAIMEIEKVSKTTEAKYTAAKQMHTSLEHFKDSLLFKWYKS